MAVGFHRTNKLRCNHISLTGVSFFSVVFLCMCMFCSTFNLLFLEENKKKTEKIESNQCNDTGWNNMSRESLYLLLKCYFIFSASAQASSTTSAFGKESIYSTMYLVFTNHSWFIIFLLLFFFSVYTSETTYIRSVHILTT